MSPHYKNYFLKGLPLWLREMVMTDIKKFEHEWIEILWEDYTIWDFSF